MTRRSHFAPALVSLALAAPGTALAQEGDPTLRDSFAIGGEGGSLCEVQATVNDRVIEGMFDRAWTIICRDASQPVGTVRMRSEEHTSELQSLMRISYAVFCLKKKKHKITLTTTKHPY